MTTENNHAPDAALTAALHQQMPLALTLDIGGVSVDADCVVTKASWHQDYCTIGDVIHGGYLMALADSSGATLAHFNLAPGETTTTVESKTNFFRPITSGDFLATSTLVHRGRSTIAVQTDITNNDSALVSRTFQTQIVLPPAQ